MTGAAVTSASRRGDHVSPGRAERVTLVVSVLTVAVIIALIVTLRLISGDSPASITTRGDWDAVFQRDGTWYLPVQVENTGDRPTDNVRVDVVREAGDPAMPEISDLSFDFLAGGESADAWAAFDARPTRSTVKFDVVSITDP